jgi:thiamine biosynthesis lipoprotein
MSRQSPESDLSALLRLAPGETLRVRDETRAVLRFALDLAEQTDGLFDPVMPGPRGREASWRDVVLSADGDLRLRRPLGVSLDGVAKGFAADRICQWLRERGARDAIVDAGGDLALACADPQPIGIRDPHRPGAIARVIELARGGVASSGNYGRISELWGREGPAGRWPRAVTVVARDCAMADALTKVAADPRAAAVLARLGAREAA